MKPVAAQDLKSTSAEQAPFARYEIRVVGRTDEGRLAALDFQEMVGQQASHSQASLSWEAGIQEVSAYARAAPKAGDKSILPKDHSLQVTSMELDLDTEVSQRFFEQLSQIGQVEGFHVVGFKSNATEQEDARLQSKGYQNYSIHHSGMSYTWLEDTSESLEGGTRLISSRVPKTQSWFQETLDESRQKRLGPLAAGLEGSYQGKVNQGDSQRQAAAQALVHGQPVRQAQSYLEGGNLLSGRRDDGRPYVLVGEDTIEITRQLIGSQSDSECSKQAALEAIAKDLKVGVEQLFAIEQPAAFHLDMRMMPIGPGQIALQDSREAAAVHLEWLKNEGRLSEEQLAKTAAKLQTWVEARAPLEDLAARDLAAAGLQVHRIAGAFADITSPEKDAVNFFNARHGVSPQGTRYSILMGGPPQAEAYFCKKVLGDFKAPVDRFYFLDPEKTSATLGMMGGLKCRSKLQGVIQTQRPPVVLTPSPVVSALQLCLFDSLEL